MSEPAMEASSSAALEQCDRVLPPAQSISNRLRSVDWDFAARSVGHPVEAIHPYPAKFVAEIPRSLLNLLPIPSGGCVLDPFCGSGTTLLEAQRLGMISVGVDLNPIACLISRVKTSPTPAGIERLAVEIAQTARHGRGRNSLDIPNVDHWFAEEVQLALSSLLLAIESSAPLVAKDALRLAISSIIVRVSNQESETRYAAVQKPVRSKDVFDLFLEACARLKRALSARDWPLVSARVLEADTLALSPMQIPLPVSVVITSPPYPNAFEYWLYHKYRMWFLGHDPLAVKTKEIGARAHFFKRNHHTEHDFWTQIRQTFRLLDECVLKEGIICFVIGSSKIHGHLVDNAAIIRSIGLEIGFEFVSEIEREIAPHRKSFNLSHARIKNESLIVFRKN